MKFLITGAASPVGKNLVQLCSEAGHHVLATYRNDVPEIQSVKNVTLKKLIVGDPLYHHQSISFISTICISLICGILLYLTALSAHSFIGNSYKITAIYSGVSFAVLIFILLMTNRFRTREA